MTYNNYLTDCLTFAKETAKWAALDHYSVYTTNGSGWKESCDNNNGGMHSALRCLHWRYAFAMASVKLCTTPKISLGIRILPC